ncbi:cyclin-like protein interacting with PHO85 [Blastocladiella emersonii ATCC 22665]|nr:cyclin-like protein interacting with PHO85 [Blastocladiella emersonii ATCC 22665]
MHTTTMPTSMNRHHLAHAHHHDAPPAPAAAPAAGKMDLLTFPVKETVGMMASLLEHITRANDQLPLPGGVVSRFHARSVPPISIHSYVNRILKYAPCANLVFISVLVYLDRMARAKVPFVVCSANIHRLLIAAVMVATKFYSDVFYTNSHYAKVGGLAVMELNQLELEFLFMNEFNLMISPQEFQHYADRLLEHAMAEKARARLAAAAAATAAGNLYPSPNTSENETQQASHLAASPNASGVAPAAEGGSAALGVSTAPTVTAPMPHPHPMLQQTTSPTAMAPTSANAHPPSFAPYQSPPQHHADGGPTRRALPAFTGSAANSPVISTPPRQPGLGGQPGHFPPPRSATAPVVSGAGSGAGAPGVYPPPPSANQHAPVRLPYYPAASSSSSSSPAAPGEFPPRFHPGPPRATGSPAQSHALSMRLPIPTISAPGSGNGSMLVPPTPAPGLRGPMPVQPQRNPSSLYISSRTPSPNSAAGLAAAAAGAPILPALPRIPHLVVPGAGALGGSDRLSPNANPHPLSNVTTSPGHMVSSPGDMDVAQSPMPAHHRAASPMDVAMHGHGPAVGGGGGVPSLPRFRFQGPAAASPLAPAGPGYYGSGHPPVQQASPMQQ